MLKRFLQLFRNEDLPTGEVDHPHREELEAQGDEGTSYLDFLFSSVHPRVQQRIQDHPSTDPILEIATGILAEIFPDYWEEPTGPLRDQWSPRTEAAPPPPPTAAQAPPAPPTDSEPPQDDEAGDEDPPTPSVISDQDDGQTVADVDEELSQEEKQESASTEESTSSKDDEGPRHDDDEEARADDEESDVERDIDEGDEEAGEEVGDDDEPVDDEQAEEPTSKVDKEEATTDDDGEHSEDDLHSQADADEDGASDEDDEVLEVDGDEFVEVAEESEIVHDAEDLDAVEERTADVDAAPPAGFVSALDETSEFEPPPVRRDTEEKSIWPQALDAPTVLRGSRVLLAVLIDNDRLPLDGQLDVGELLLAADLWVHLMAQATDLDQRAQSLARLVERKFETNHFSQARLLLELFPANLNTRIKHDRQLFYEDMILRLGVRRGQPLDSPSDSGLEANLRELDLSDDEELRRGFEELAQEARIRMHVYTREPSEVEKWRQLAECCSWPDAVPYILGKLPPRRWREAHVARERSIRTSLQEHIVRPMARDHVITHIKACYFVLRAVGDTGLEPYLDCFFDWSESFCDVNATTFLSRLHRRVQGNRDTIDDIFGEIYRQYYHDPIADALDKLDDQLLERSFSRAMEHLSTTDFAEVAGGNFNLGAFVLDAFLEIEHPSPEFSFKLHRLT